MSIIDQSVHLIELRSVTKRFGGFTALDGVDLTVGRGEFVGVVGRSGSGKSTLLNLVAGIDRPSEGEVWVDGRPVHSLDESELAAWRGTHVGVVFQFFQLLPTLTVLENVMLPMDFCRTCTGAAARTRALSLLDRFDIADQADKLPSSLSGGQQQRAAIARALANDPPLVVADEPTGNLDSETGEAVVDLLASLTEMEKTVVMVTHERAVMKRVDRMVTLADGKVVA